MAAGICGWIHAGPAPVRGQPPARDEAAAAAAMRSALIHRGEIGSFSSAWDDSGPGLQVAADTAFNTLEQIRTAWALSEGDPQEFASRLRGSFAVALHDPKRRTLLLVRDRLGEKPLLFSAGPEGIAFASEMKALRAASLAGDGGLRPEAVDAFFAFTYIPAPWTVHEDIHKVPAGHLVRFDLGDGGPPRPRMERYWAAPPRANRGAIPGEALERLGAALERRTPRSGTLVAFLSGGLDSSLVVALLARAGHRGITTLSIGFADEKLDESAHSRRVASLLGTNHQEIILNEVTEDLAIRAVRHLDEPMADAASLPTMILAEAASRSASVVMTGDGADALLAGDHWFRRLRWMDRLERMPSAGRRALAAAASLGAGRSAARMQMHAELAGLDPALRYLRIREKWTPAERESIYSEDFGRRVDTSLAGATYLRAPVNWRRGESVDAAVRLDTIHGLPEDLLMKVDKMGMAHGVECRSPFLDTEWVEWISGLRIDLLLRGRTSKYILKQAAKPLLPSRLIGRRKQGFRVPMERWLKGPLKGLLEEAFSPELVRGQGIFEPAALSSLKARFLAGPSTAALSGRIWQVVAFQTWWLRGRL